MNLNTCFYYWWDSIIWENISAQIGKCEDKEVEKKWYQEKKLNFENVKDRQNWYYDYSEVKRMIKTLKWINVQNCL